MDQHQSETPESKLENKEVDNSGINYLIKKIQLTTKLMFRTIFEPELTSHITNLQDILIRSVNVLKEAQLSLSHPECIQPANKKYNCCVEVAAYSYQNLLLCPT